MPPVRRTASLFRSSFVVLAALLVASPAAASLILNGSFESPNVGPGGIATFFPGPIDPAFGWRVDTGNVEVASETYAPLPGPSFDGVQHLDLNGVLVGAISQVFATVAGTSYTLQFAYSSNYVTNGTSNPAQARVEIVDGATTNALVTPLVVTHGTAGALDLDWRTASLGFVATGTTTQVRFISESTANRFGGILLDGISVPEPAMLVLVAGALAAGTRGRIRGH